MRVLLTSPPLHGHVRPLLALGEELRSRGHEVHAILPEGLRPLAAAGVLVHTYESRWSHGSRPTEFALPRDDVRNSRARAAFSAQLASVAEVYSALLDDLTPDVVVADTTAAHAAAHRDRHALVWHSPTFVSPDVAAHLRAGRDDDAPDPILVAVAPFLHPPADTVPGLRFIGPAVATAGRSAAPDTVFVSAGTSYNRDAALFSDAILAVDGLPYRPVVATGDAGVAARLSRRFPAARITAWVDQPRVLADTAVFISTGGIGSLQQAVAAGVPAVVVPQSPEQRANAAALVRFGCGVAIEPEAVTPDVLTRAIRHLTAATDVGSALATARELLSDLGGVREGADVVEQAGGGA